MKPMSEIETLRAENAKLKKKLARLLADENLLLWGTGRVVCYASEEPWEIALRFADENNLGPGEEGFAKVQVAARLPDRKMHVWRDRKGKMFWEWEDEV